MASSATKSKVLVDIKINCGCGFKPQDLQAAKEHSEQTGHVMELNGTLGPVGRLGKVRTL